MRFTNSVVTTNKLQLSNQPLNFLIHKQHITSSHILARSDYHPVKRGHYKLPQRLKTMQNIRELIIQGYTYNAIMQQLHIPHRTFYRLLSALLEDDRRLLSEVVTDDEKLNQMAICRDRLLGDRVRMLQMVEDKNFQDRVAQHLASEIAVVIMKIYTE